METAENKYITVAYKLYTTEDGKRDLVEETAAEHPFQFISGLGTTLEAFESQIPKISLRLTENSITNISIRETSFL